MRIFLSAVSAQFKECRDALASDLRAVGAEVLVQEDFQQHGRSLLEKLEQYIASCDRVIALIGDAYGGEPDTDVAPGLPQRSYAQWEYSFAEGERLQTKRQPAIDTYVYFASQAFLASRRVLQETGATQRQVSFVDKVRLSGKDRWEFGSIDELRALVLRDGFRMPSGDRVQLVPRRRAVPKALSRRTALLLVLVILSTAAGLALLLPYLERPYVFAVGFVDDSTGNKSDNLDQFSAGIIKHLVARVPLNQSGRHRMAVTQDGRWLLVTNAGSSSLSIIDSADLRKEPKNVNVGAYPAFVAVSRDGKAALVSNLQSNTVSIVDIPMGRTIGEEIPIRNPGRAAFTPDGKLAYVVNGASDKEPELGTVSILEFDDRRITPANVARVKITPVQLEGCAPSGLALSKNGDRAYITNYNSDSVSIVSSASKKVLRTVEIDPNTRGLFKQSLEKGGLPCSDLAPYRPIDIIISPDDSVAYVAADAKFSLRVLSLADNQIVQVPFGPDDKSEGYMFPAGDNPTKLALSNNGERLYVASWQSPEILVLSTKNPKKPWLMGRIVIPDYQKKSYRRDFVVALPQ